MAVDAYGLQIFYYSHSSDLSEESQELHSVVPLFHHLTSTILTYAYSSSTYYLDSLITPNFPILFMPLNGTFDLSPALPDGMQFDTQTGIISGRPRVTTPNQFYVIHMYTNDNQYAVLTTMISFLVLCISIPFFLYY